MNIKFQVFVVIFLLLLAVGCGGSNCAVTGKVSFPDGTPLTEGEVIFESATSMSKGAIQKDGTYTMSSGEKKGVSKGTYQVSLSGFAFEKMIPSEIEGRPPTFIPQEIPVDRKFLSPATSSLTCEVKGRTKYDIKVEAPAK